MVRRTVTVCICCLIAAGVFFASSMTRRKEPEPRAAVAIHGTHATTSLSSNSQDAPPGMRAVVETKSLLVNYTVVKPVYETHEKEITYTVMKPVYETKVKTVTYTVCTMVPETRTKTCTYTTCKMVPEQKTRTEEFTEVRYEPVVSSAEPAHP